ncbi:MAG: family 10 glycosylhydrolase [Rhodothermales bacterium]|nr:family 10 glycosylhydrolase [Rhodothermales bacterium]
MNRLDNQYRVPGPFAVLTLMLLLAGCSAGEVLLNTDSPNVPMPNEEFRGVWVASVANIDWPSRTDLSTEEQKRELRQILDRAQRLNFNAIVLQVRPAADALYESSLEPWSEYLTGEMGRPPSPFYDPLEFAVNEAHNRGLELHAWVNPFRARHPTATSPNTPDHVSQRKPGAVVAYGEYLWMNPGDPVAQEHSLAVMLDIVERYDIDGLHIDDYFYPYEIQDSTGTVVEFPDGGVYAQYLATGDTLAIADWRRMSIDRFVEQLYQGIKRVKPHVKFGISPFGIWRPGNPPQIQGYDPYEKLYADSRKWLKEGWVDYFTPQLYWKIDVPEQSYSALLDWWIAQNDKGRHIWPGNFTSRVFLEGDRRWDPVEIINQVELTQDTGGASGNVHFSMKSLFDNGTGMAFELGAGPYRAPAIVPATRWLGAETPPRPMLRIEDLGTGDLVTFGMADGSPEVARWIVWRFDNDSWVTEILGGWRSGVFISAEDEETAGVAVAAISRTGVVGPVAAIRRD